MQHRHILGEIQSEGILAPVKIQKSGSAKLVPIDGSQDPLEIGGGGTPSCPLQRRDLVILKVALISGPMENQEYRCQQPVEKQPGSLRHEKF